MSYKHTVYLSIAGIVRTCDAYDGATITYGRDRVTEATDPAHAAVVIAGPLKTAALGSTVEIDVETAGAGRVRRFTGTITDLDTVLEPSGEVSQTRLVAVSTGLGTMARRFVGDEPWPVETAGVRIGRLIDLAGVGRGTVDPGDVDVVAEDRDSTEALDLAQTAALDALGVLVDDLAGTVSYHAAARRAIAPTIELDACETEQGATTAQRIGDLRNRARIRYGDPAVEVVAQDPASIARFGIYDVSRSTTLATGIDAQTIAERTVALYAFPAWTLPRWSVPLHLLDPARADELAALRISDHVSLLNLPPPLSDGATAYVEGWTETLTSTTRDLDLTLSDTSLSYPVQRWRDLSPAGPAWDDLDPVAPTWRAAWTTPIA